MNLIQKNISFNFTGNCIQSSEITSETKEIWIVFHGYAQLPEFFIKKFEFLFSNDRVVVAPEASALFYLNGFYGKVGASWLTKHNRSTHIQNQIEFLNQVFKSLQIPEDCKLNIFAFSQGVSASLRWLSQSKVDCNHAILWAGSYPEEITNFNCTLHKVNYVFGTEDELYDEQKVKLYTDKLKSISKQFNFNEFIGGHIIDIQLLKDLINRK